uniref:Uncharacterized protein n=1 Tax=Eutreptiella gymnastica TaxID=73025 RepID=A0A7S4G7X8_9EUGL
MSVGHAIGPPVKGRNGLQQALRRGALCRGLAQSSFKLHQFLCSKGYVMDNLDEPQGIHLSLKLHPYLQSNSSVRACLIDDFCSASSACMQLTASVASAKGGCQWAGRNTIKAHTVGAGGSMQECNDKKAVQCRPRSRQERPEGALGLRRSRLHDCTDPHDCEEESLSLKGRYPNDKRFLMGRYPDKPTSKLMDGRTAP